MEYTHRKNWEDLARAVVAEQDRDRFTALVSELNETLEADERRQAEMFDHQK